MFKMDNKNSSTNTIQCLVGHFPKTKINVSEFARSLRLQSTATFNSDSLKGELEVDDIKEDLVFDTILMKRWRDNDRISSIILMKKVENPEKRNTFKPEFIDSKIEIEVRFLSNP